MRAAQRERRTERRAQGREGKRGLSEEARCGSSLSLNHQSESSSGASEVNLADRQQAPSAERWAAASANRCRARQKEQRSTKYRTKPPSELTKEICTRATGANRRLDNSRSPTSQEMRPTSLLRSAASAAPTPAKQLEYATGLVRKFDSDAIYPSHFYPASVRPAYLALRAFNIELATIDDNVSNPMVGRMRYQWWRDAVKGIFEVRALARHRLQLSTAEARCSSQRYQPCS